MRFAHTFLVVFLLLISGYYAFSQSDSLEVSSVVDTVSLPIQTEKSDEDITSTPETLLEKADSTTQSIQLDSTAVSEKMDSTAAKPIMLTPQAAAEFVLRVSESKSIKRNEDVFFWQSIRRLAGQFSEPLDSSIRNLNRFDWESVELEPTRIVSLDTLSIRWLNSSMFIVDTVKLERNPVFEKKTVLMTLVEPLALSAINLSQESEEQIKELFSKTDTVTETIIDKAYLQSKGVNIYELKEGVISPPLRYKKGFNAYKFTKDSTGYVFASSKKGFGKGGDSPFKFLPQVAIVDSLKASIETLIEYTQDRDSILLDISDRQGNSIPMWLGTGREDLHRYWVKNSKNDSITIWIGNPTRHNLLLALEENVSVERAERKQADEIPFVSFQPSRELVKLKPLTEIPVHWQYGFVGSYALSESYFSTYWAQGGESSLNSMLDMHAHSQYNNKAKQQQWSNTGRLRYGTTWTRANRFRTTTDIVEINSQFNKVLRKKLDFSSILYMKSQVAKGYNYPNDSIPISKFLNPGAITIGVGMEYKPQPKTSINFSLLSYRNSFVLDTVTIDQTNHGIDAEKKSKQELGGQLVAKNSIVLFKDMEINNTLRLFSSYLKKPQNVDVDWEISIEKQISIYFKIKLSAHLIYNEDILFPIVDKNGNPVMLSSGVQKKGPRTQFNQMLGLTLQLKI